MPRTGLFGTAVILASMMSVTSFDNVGSFPSGGVRFLSFFGNRGWS